MKRPLSASRAYVYGSMFNTRPPGYDDGDDDEGGMAALESEGFDLDCDEDDERGVEA